MDHGISGIDPEPRHGYRDSRDRDRALEAFSDACWQRQERAKQSHSAHTWPDRRTFRQNWPKLAWQLIEASWWVEGAQSDTSQGDVIDVELLDPSPAPRRHWAELYAFELFQNPTFEETLKRKPDQSPGDNIELVMELAGLTANERLVLRAFLADDELDDLARDLGWRLNTVQILLRNALDRVRFVAQNHLLADERVQRRVVGKGERNGAGRNRDSSWLLQRAHASRARAQRVDRVS